MERRDFVKICAGAVAWVYAKPDLLAANMTGAQTHNRVLLSDNTGKPLLASSLDTSDAYIFHYPYVSTPCFLINLGKAVPAQSINGEKWPGGVGKQQSVVAFSAICSHQFSYPTKKIAFINYNPNKTKVADSAQTIVCCAHQTVFDPSKGAQVITGPTKVPLTTIVLEYDQSKDQLYAVATMGKDYYGDFFRAYKRDLIDLYGRGKAKHKVENNSVALLHSAYTTQKALC